MFWLSWLWVGISIVVGRSRVQQDNDDAVAAECVMVPWLSWLLVSISIVVSRSRVQCTVMMLLLLCVSWCHGMGMFWLSWLLVGKSRV